MYVDFTKVKVILFKRSCVQGSDATKVGFENFIYKLACFYVQSCMYKILKW